MTAIAPGAAKPPAEAAAAAADRADGWADRSYLESVCAALDGRPLSARGQADRGVLRVEPGLTDREIERAEARFELRFPADLRALLQYGLPTGWDWPNWRDPDTDDYLRWALGRPWRAMAFDVLNNGVWFPAWGPRPASEAECARIAVDALAGAPRLVPVHAHHFVPSEPPQAGNPVVSCTQIIDTVYAGNDLAGYLAATFGGDRPAWARPDDLRRKVPFWSAIVESGGSSLD